MQVVAYKTAEWRGTEHDGYLRPSTVFGPKFDAYLQAAQHACDADPGRGGLVDEWAGREPGEVINGRVVPFGHGLRGPSPPEEGPA